jgi:hypothetical protein
MNARFCCSTSVQSWQALIWTTVAIFSSGRACTFPSPDTEKSDMRNILDLWRFIDNSVVLMSPLAILFRNVLPGVVRAGMYMNTLLVLISWKMNARFCCSTSVQSWQALIWTTAAIFSSERAHTSPAIEKTHTNTRAVIPMIMRIAFSLRY